jgi:hypothetical protein
MSFRFIAEWHINKENIYTANYNCFVLTYNNISQLFIKLTLT